VVPNRDLEAAKAGQLNVGMEMGGGGGGLGLG